MHKEIFLNLTRLSKESTLPEIIESCFRPKSRFTSVSGLWTQSIKALAPLIAQSTLISIGVALCAMTSAFSAMELLRPDQTVQNLLKFVGLYFFANIAGQVGSYFNNRTRIFANHSMQAFLVTLISRKLLLLSSRSAAKQSMGNLKVLITSDADHVAEFADNVVRNLIPALAALPVIVPSLVYLTGNAGLAGILIMFLYLPLAFALGQINTKFQNGGQYALDSLASLLGEWIKNIRLVRYLSWNELFQKDILLKLRRYMEFCTSQHLMACLTFGLSVSWWMVAVFGVFLVAKWTGAPFDISRFFGSLWMITFLSGYFIHLPNTIRLFSLASPSMKRIAVLLSQEEQQELFQKLETDPFPASDLLISQPIGLCFEEVSFSYDGSKNVIDRINLKIDLRKKIAIVGEVAAGKSTFLKLLSGEIPPTQGRILIEFGDGTFRNLWVEKWHHAFRSQVARVPQEPFVASDPISENISLGSDSKESDLIEAVYWAELEADIKAFPRGIHEEVGESGINLSGGQRQRLNIARAYFSGRSYLVLDDVLSAVDSRTEAALMKRFEDRSHGFILTTHRTEELMRVDEILVMKNGQFTERGNPRLLSTDPSTQFSKVLRAYQNEDRHA